MKIMRTLASTSLMRTQEITCIIQLDTAIGPCMWMSTSVLCTQEIACAIRAETSRGYFGRSNNSVSREVQRCNGSLQCHMTLTRKFQRREQYQKCGALQFSSAYA